MFKDFLLEQEVSLYVCRTKDPQTKGQIEKLVKYVKSNYFSARLKDGLSIEKAIAGIPKWCDRKNNAIRLPFHRIPSLSLKEEAAYLRPLVASQYSELSCPYTINSVDKLGYITYLSNKYSVPKILKNTKLRTKVYGERLYVYEIESDYSVPLRVQTIDNELGGRRWQRFRDGLTRKKQTLCCRF